jgi:hypothetical protein
VHHAQAAAAATCLVQVATEPIISTLPIKPSWMLSINAINPRQQSPYRSCGHSLHNALLSSGHPAGSQACLSQASAANAVAAACDMHVESA